MPTTKKATIYLILIYLKPYIIYYLFKEVLISAPNMIYIKESEILSDEGICKKKDGNYREVLWDIFFFGEYVARQKFKDTVDIVDVDFPYNWWL